MKNPKSILRSIKDKLAEYKLGVIEWDEKQVRKLQRARQALLNQLETEYQPGEWVN